MQWQTNGDAIPHVANRCMRLHCKSSRSHISCCPGQLELVEADLLGGEAAFAAAFRGCRYVFHCASPFFIEAADPQVGWLHMDGAGGQTWVDTVGQKCVCRVPTR